MATQSVRASTPHGRSTARYVAPFLLFMAALAVFGRFPISPALSGPLWVVALLPVAIACWPREISPLPRYTLGSIAIGLLAFVVWIGPEVLFPGYRNLPLFSNVIMGHAHSSVPAAALRSPWVLMWRTLRAVVLVPIVEELFWRGWLMRWLVNPDFEEVRFGAFSPLAFWATAALFASEHGPYWDVGFITGIIYNGWMLRTKSLADCVLMHAVTNALLCAYVITGGHWQYWQ